LNFESIKSLQFTAALSLGLLNWIRQLSNVRGCNCCSVPWKKKS